MVFGVVPSYLDNKGINATRKNKKSPVFIGIQPIYRGGCYRDSIRDMLIPPRTEHQEGSHNYVCS